MSALDVSRSAWSKLVLRYLTMKSMMKEFEAFFTSKSPAVAVAWITGMIVMWVCADVVFALYLEWDEENDWRVPYAVGLPIVAVVLSSLMFGVLKMRGPRTAMRLAAYLAAFAIIGTSFAGYYAHYDYNPSGAIGPPGWVCAVVSLAFTVPFAIFMWKVLVNAGNTMHRSTE